jgi:hypothetical protein
MRAYSEDQPIRKADERFVPVRFCLSKIVYNRRIPFKESNEQYCSERNRGLPSAPDV